jgi:hypothetical protein
MNQLDMLNESSCNIRIVIGGLNSFSSNYSLWIIPVYFNATSIRFALLKKETWSIF